MRSREHTATVHAEEDGGEKQGRRKQRKKEKNLKQRRKKKANPSPVEMDLKRVVLKYLLL